MGGVKVLVFSAHAADFCSRSGGTILLSTHAGALVHTVDLTMGERGESEDYWASPAPRSIGEAKQVRMQEAKKAAALIGSTIEFADYDDYPLVIDKTRLESLARIMRKHRPDVILTHWKVDPSNIDHEVTTSAVIRAATMAAVPGFAHDESEQHQFPHMFGFEPSVPWDDDARFRPDTYVDITDVFETKREALEALHSQLALPDRYTQWAEYRGTQATRWAGHPIKYAEAFKRLTPSVGNHLPVTPWGH